MATVENLLSKIIWLDPFSTTSKCVHEVALYKEKEFSQFTHVGRDHPVETLASVVLTTNF